MRVIHWRGDSAFTSLFVRDNQELVPLAIPGGLQLCWLEAGGPMMLALWRLVMDVAEPFFQLDCLQVPYKATKIHPTGLTI